MAGPRAPQSVPRIEKKDPEQLILDPKLQMRSDGRSPAGSDPGCGDTALPPALTSNLLASPPRLLPPWAPSEQKRAIITLTAWGRNGSHFSDEAFNILITGNYDTAGDGTIELWERSFNDANVLNLSIIFFFLTEYKIWESAN